MPSNFKQVIKEGRLIVSVSALILLIAIPSSPCSVVFAFCQTMTTCTTFSTGRTMLILNSDGIASSSAKENKSIDVVDRRRSSRLAILNAVKDCDDEKEPLTAMVMRQRSSRNTKRKIHTKLDDSVATKIDENRTAIANKRQQQGNRSLSCNTTLPTIGIVNEKAEDSDQNILDIGIAPSNIVMVDTKLNRYSKIATPTTLPRTLEESIRRNRPNVQYVLGIDEAGRGPLAGPVVIGGVRMMGKFCDDPTNIVNGVTDSKKITSELQRELLYEQILTALSEGDSTAATTIDIENVLDTSDDSSSTTLTMGAIAVIDAATIDEINILQATLLGMRLVALVITGQTIHYPIISINEMNKLSVPMKGCYVISVAKNGITKKERSSGNALDGSSGAVEGCNDSIYHALIDGNRLPTEMPCPADAIVKGDSREYCIAAASILAKVTRDRIMHQYHMLYPNYNFTQHKGYPTAAHVNAIRTHGPSPIHRLTFAPMKSKKITGSRTSKSKT